MTVSRVPWATRLGDSPMLTNQYDESRAPEQSPYQPTPADRTEAAQLFGELADDLDVAEFEAWLEGLHTERFRAVTRAIDVLRKSEKIQRSVTELG